MALIRILGGNLTTPTNFDTYIETQTITITIPSDTSGRFQREIISSILGAAKTGVVFSDLPATFTNGEAAANNKITSIAIA